MDFLREYWLFLLPLILAQFSLAIIALIHVLKHPYYRIGNKATWIFIVLFVNIIGPVAYFVFGRGEE